MSICVVRAGVQETVRDHRQTRRPGGVAGAGGAGQQLGVCQAHPPPHLPNGQAGPQPGGQSGQHLGGR
jgi:hypothetical protein